MGYSWPEMAALNPRLIYCSVTLCGQTGPYASKPGHDPVALAIAGALSRIGEDPDRPGLPRRARRRSAQRLERGDRHPRRGHRARDARARASRSISRCRTARSRLSPTSCRATRIWRRRRPRACTAPTAASGDAPTDSASSPPTWSRATGASSSRAIGLPELRRDKQMDRADWPAMKDAHRAGDRDQNPRRNGSTCSTRPARSSRRS